MNVCTHTWADAQENAFPDFSQNHNCRDEHSVPIQEFGAIRKPELFEPYVMVGEHADKCLGRAELEGRTCQI